MYRGDYGRASALSQPRLDPLDPINKALLGYWPLSEGRGLTAFDLTANRNHGVIRNFGAYPWVPAFNGTGQALNCDGSDDYIDCGLSSVLKPATAFSVSAWSYSAGSQASFAGIASSAQTSGLGGGFLLVNGGGLIKFLLDTTSGGSYAIATADNVITNGIWDYYIGVWNGAATFLYRNGVLQAATGTAASCAYGTSATGFAIGRYSGFSSGSWLGRVGNVRLINRAISASEAQRLYREPFAGLIFPEDDVVYNSRSIGASGRTLSAALTEAPDSISISGAVAVKVSAALAEAADSTSGTLAHSGSVHAALVEASDSISISTHVALHVSAALIEAKDSSSISLHNAAATLRIFVIAPYLTTDTIGTKQFQLYDVESGVLTAIGAAITTGFTAIPNITNGWWVAIDVPTNGGYGDFAGIAVFSNINGSARAIELYSPPTSIPASLVIDKVAPFQDSDVITTPGYQLYDKTGANLGSHVTSGILSIPGVTNGYVTKVTLTPDAQGGFRGGILWDGG